MKILVIHNLLWAHYKSVLFQEIQKKMDPSNNFHVLQIAKNEESRRNMESPETAYVYNYTLLFNDYIENVPKWKEIAAVLRFFLKFKPDVVNITGYSASVSTLPVIVLAKIVGVKIVMSNESTAVDKREQGAKEWIKRWAVKVCAGFITFGKSSEKYLLNLGADPGKILIKHAAVVDNNSIWERYQMASQQNPYSEIITAKNFIFIGRISPEKNVRLLVEAFQKLVQPLEPWGLIIVGNGQEESLIKEQIQLNPAHIYTYNAVSWNEVPAFFSRADCLVLPSNSEPWGLVVNEAMVCGLTAIVSEACGCAEDLIQGNGFVVETGSLPALQAAMQNMVDAPDLSSMKTKSKEIIRTFSVAKVAEEFATKIPAIARV